MLTLQNLQTTLERSRKVLLATIVLGLLMAPTAYGAYLKTQSATTEKASPAEILGISQSQSPEPTASPSPSPSSSPQITKPKVQITSPTPTPLSASTSPQPANSQSLQNISQSTPSDSDNQPSPSPLLIPSPSPPAVNVGISVVYTGAADKNADSYSIAVYENQTAWNVAKNAIGIENLQYTDYGGDLGIFITGINGVVPLGNQFWEFRVNGQVASVGVSTYICKSGDTLNFVIASF